MQWVLVDPRDQDPFEQQANTIADRRRNEQRQPEAASQCLDSDESERTDGDELAMRQVDDVHQPKDDS